MARNEREAQRNARRSIYAREFPYRGRTFGYRTVTVERLAKFGARYSAHLLRRALPRMTRAQHARRAYSFELGAVRVAGAYSRALSAAFLATFGREPRVTDYKIAGVWRDEFSERVKARLRALAHAETRLRDRAAAHFHAAQYLRNLAGER